MGSIVVTEGLRCSSAVEFPHTKDRICRILTTGPPGKSGIFLFEEWVSVLEMGNKRRKYKVPLKVKGQIISFSGVRIGALFNNIGHS